MNSNNTSSCSLCLYIFKAFKYFWMIDFISEQLTEARADILRQDMNMEPLMYWQRKDASDRQGITEIRFVEGMYEILDYDSTLELVDPQGATATFKRRQRVKFLQDNIIAFQDHAWGDGEIFADYKCSPGIEVDRYQAGDRWNVLISLRETKSAGDVEDFYIERTVRGGFTQNEEWRQIEIRHRTKRLKLAIIFPEERRVRILSPGETSSAFLIGRSSPSTVVTL